MVKFPVEGEYDPDKLLNSPERATTLRFPAAIKNLFQTQKSEPVTELRLYSATKNFKKTDQNQS